MPIATKSGKKNRKWGSQKDKPCQKRYTAEKRWILNKAHKIAKVMRENPNWNPKTFTVEVSRILRDNYNIPKHKLNL